MSDLIDRVEAAIEACVEPDGVLDLKRAARAAVEAMEADAAAPAA